MEITACYQNWLVSKSYSDATVRNYVMDVKKYIDFSSNTAEKIFNDENLSSYFQNINQDPNYKRFLASLSKFFQFALDQNLISENPFSKALKNQPKNTDQDMVEIYQKHLETKKFSISTIRNYINDIHQFINWAQKVESK